MIDRCVLSISSRLREKREVALNFRRYSNLTKLDGRYSMILALFGKDLVKNLPHLTNLSMSHVMTKDSIRDLVSLTTIDLANNHSVTLDAFKNLSNLTSLKLNGSLVFDATTNQPIEYLINLKKLFVSHLSTISFQDISKLTNLEYLSLNNNTITNQEICRLTNLKSLCLLTNTLAINDDGISTLTNLTSLSLFENRIISDEGIRGLTNLSKLGIRMHEKISFDTIYGLPYLTSLIINVRHLSQNHALSDHEMFTTLTNLKSLNISRDRNFSNFTISKMTNLTSLDCSNSRQISNEVIRSLTNLKKLVMNNTDSIRDEGIENLTNLTTLSMIDNFKISNNGVRRLTKLKTLYFGSSFSGMPKVTSQVFKELPFLRNLY